MPDNIDLANALVDSEVSRALDKMRQNSSQDKVLTKYCVECGDEVPEPRRKMGFKFCISCAEEAERKKSRFAG